MYRIGKTFKYDGAHRIYNQDLNKFCDTTLESLNKEEKCKCIHGHTVKIVAEIASEELIDDMVLDFNYLKSFKIDIDKWFDHKFVIYKEDPLAKFFIKHMADIPTDVKDGIVISSFNPTAENLSKYFYTVLNSILKEVKGVFTTSIKVYETETSYAEFRYPDENPEVYFLASLPTYVKKFNKE